MPAPHDGVATVHPAGLMPAATPSCRAVIIWCSHYDRSICHHASVKARMVIKTPKKSKVQKKYITFCIVCTVYVICGVITRFALFVGLGI